VSPDGKYFFFMSSKLERPERLTFRVLRELQEQPGNGNADIYWVDGGLVTSLRSRAVFGALPSRSHATLPSLATGDGTSPRVALANGASNGRELR
jgi:hypothetical protein